MSEKQILRLAQKAFISRAVAGIALKRHRPPSPKGLYPLLLELLKRADFVYSPLYGCGALAAAKAFSDPNVPAPD